MKQVAARDLHQHTLLEAARLVEQRKVSPLELTDAVLKQIERAEPKINAFITVVADQARAVARAHEAMINAGRTSNDILDGDIARRCWQAHFLRFFRDQRKQRSNSVEGGTRREEDPMDRTKS